MARYILLDIEDDDDAYEFLQHVKKLEEVTVRGVFAKPTRFCECGPLSDLEHQQQVTRGIKYGWWVHRTCRLARSAVQNPKNLYEDPRAPNDYYLHLTPTPISITAPYKPRVIPTRRRRRRR